MKTLLLAAAFGLGVLLTGCSEGKKGAPAEENGGPKAADSGAGVGADGKKNPRIPAPGGPGAPK